MSNNNHNNARQHILGHKIFLNDVQLMHNSDQIIFTNKIIGDTDNRLLKLWVTDITCTNNIAANLTGNVTGNCSGSSGSCTGTANVASNVTVAASTDGTSYVAIVGDVAGNMPVKTDSTFSFDAFSHILTVGNLNVDNININGSTITGISDANTVLTAYAGKAVAVEGVSFDGGAVTGITTLSMNNQLTNTLAVGTAPMVITSTTKVANLNVEQVDGADLDTNTTIENSDTKIPSSSAVYAHTNNTTTAHNINLNALKAQTTRGLLTLEIVEETATNNESGAGYAVFNENDTDIAYFKVMIPPDFKTGGKVDFVIALYESADAGSKVVFHNVQLARYPKDAISNYINNWNGETTDIITLTSAAGGNKTHHNTILTDSTAFAAYDEVFLALTRKASHSDDNWGIAYLIPYLLYERVLD